MGRLIAFNNVSLDGFFCDAKGDMSAFYRPADDPEWKAFVDGNASGGGMLLFGRVTYDLMASYWPTPLAAESSPVVAERMNSASKVVFSRTMSKAAWVNTTVVKGDIAAEVRRLKANAEPGMAILGSGSIVAQLAPEGLIDELQLVVNPVVLGKGKTLFEGVSRRLEFRLKSARSFSNGNVVLCYQPA
jgi:dihydrofolate reductase